MSAACVETNAMSALLGAVVVQSAKDRPERVAEDALELLAAGPEDRILELGCGSGRLLFRLAARTRRGLVVGVDPLALMVRHARHRNRRWIEAGRAAVEAGRSDDLSVFPDRHFHAALGVHVACFWEEPERDLAEVRRVLQPGGRLLLGFRPEEPPDGAHPTWHDPARLDPGRVAGWLRDAGFARVEPVAPAACRSALAWVRAHA